MDYVITVEFEIDPLQFGAFLPLVRENARLSREREPGCLQFDVCIDPAQPSAVFLYERYADRAAFDAHLESSHFRAFDAAVRDMIVAKSVRALLRADPD